MRFFGLIPSFWAGVPKGQPKPFKSNRSTDGSYVGSDGLIHWAKPFSLRPLYTKQGDTWVYSGDLKEDEASNVVKTPSSWSKLRLNVSTGQLAVDGTNSAIRFTKFQNVGNTWYAVTSDVFPGLPAGPQVFSVYVSDCTDRYFRMDVSNSSSSTDGSVSFDTQDGNKAYDFSGAEKAEGTCGFEVLGGGFTRYWIVYPSWIGATEVSSGSIVSGTPATTNASPDSGFTLCLPQYESGTVPSSPIAVTGNSPTDRPAD